MFKIVFAKALQVCLFVKFCDGIMGWKHVGTLQMGPPSNKECVVKSVKVRPNKEKLNPSWRQKEEELNP